MGCSNIWEVISMYSMVLMAALTTGVDLPDRRGGCCGGCYGGCHGGRRHGCHGCGGGCYGGYGYGCMGYGGCMGMGYGGCYGSGMGYGGCMGMGYGGCYGSGMGYGGGCYGSGMGCYGGGMGCYGGGMGSGGGVILQGTPQPSGEKAPKPKEKREESKVPAPVTIVVDLPADAKLLIENEATTSTGDSRVFQSPTLTPGKEYQYTLTAEVVRDGKPIKAEQVVTVKAGQVIPVTVTLPTSGVAQR
jgi:uncharacterized protein (TIGR03000 family)